MPHERLKAVADTLRQKAARRREKRKKEQTKDAAERFARKRRIERNEPEGAVERATATVRQAKDAAGATREFIGATGVGQAADQFAEGGKQAAERASAAADALEPPDGDGDPPDMATPADGMGGASRTVIADEDTRILTPPAAAYSGELAPFFDSVSEADTDGVVETKDVRASLDINGDGDIDAGEQFRAVTAPDDLEDVPRRDAPSDDPLDDILI